MKISKVSVSTGRTINMGNYESLRLDLSIEATIDSDSFSADMKKLNSVLESEFENLVSSKISNLRNTN